MIGEIRPLTSLRGIAALLVVGYHANLWLPGTPLPGTLVRYGFLGVDIFFVLSGYIMATVHHDLTPATSTMFFVKRLCRLYPLHVTIMMALALKSILLARFVPGYVMPSSWSTFLPVLFLVQPLLGIDHCWNDPSWSIGVELVCYAIFPFVIPALSSARPRSNAAAATLLLVASMLLIYGTVVPFETSLVTPTAGVDAVLRGACGFFAGCALRSLIDPPSIAHSTLGRAISVRPLYNLGEVSFSIYLLHQPIINAVAKLTPSLARHLGDLTASRIALLIAVAATVLLSQVTFTLIETSGRRIPWLLANRWSVKVA